MTTNTNVLVTVHENSLLLNKNTQCVSAAKEKANERNVNNNRDYDSLNNLVILESDTESMFNDTKNELFSKDKDTDNASVLTKASDGCEFAECSYTESCGRKNNSKVMFKAELDNHTSLVRRGLKDGSRRTEEKYKFSSKKSIWRSFIALCFGLMFAFISFMPLRNIQTSLYPIHSLGNLCLACMYSCFAIGCLFSSWITQNARPKGIILVALFGHVLFCGVNIYPKFYTLIPAACFFGFIHAPLWSTQELMIASFGASYTAVSKLDIDKAIQQFQSVFLVFCHAAQVLGNLMESAILDCGDQRNRPMNISIYHTSFDEFLFSKEINITNITEYKADTTKQLIWIGPFGYPIQSEMNFPNDKINYENIMKYVFLSCAALGMAIIGLCLNRPDIIVHKKKATLSVRMKEIAGFLPTGTCLSLFLLMLFSGMQQAVVIGNVTKLYGTLTLGVSMVGYMMMCYGTCQLLVLLVMEKLQTHLRPSIAIFTAFLINLGLLVWLYIWEPSETYTFKILGYIGLWGAVDGLWQSQVQNVLLAWTVGRKEAAVTVFRTVQCFGLVLVFLLDIWMSLLNLICICCAILVLGVIFYLILEVVRTPLTSLDPPPYAL